MVSRDGEMVTDHHIGEGSAKVIVSHASTSHRAMTWAMDAANDMVLLKAPPAVGLAATFSQSLRASLGSADAYE